MITTIELFTSCKCNNAGDREVCNVRTDLAIFLNQWDCKTNRWKDNEGGRIGQAVAIKESGKMKELHGGDRNKKPRRPNLLERAP